jgi:hypothetical protein
MATVADLLNLNADIVYDATVKNSKESFAVVWTKDQKGQLIAIARPPFSKMLEQVVSGMNENLKNQISSSPD